jgi:hypothetical protein
MSTDNRLGYIEIGGTPYEVGVQFGCFGREIVHRHLIVSHAWASVTASRADPRVAAMRRIVEERFPTYWSELQGMASGLDLPFDDVFLWNCRGDVWAMAPDGCTTVQIPGDRPVLAHNEDGDPGFRGHCALAHVRPAGATAFTSFVYPASIPGHTFAATETGLVQTVNNIRSRDVGPGVPRMIIGRALMDCGSLDQAIQLIRATERAGAFHMTLGHRGDRRLLSVEFTHKNCSVTAIERLRCHANHLIHEDMTEENQVITGSSLSRQQRGDAIVAAAENTLQDPLQVLWDNAVSPLPIYRAQPDDPDHENTLATAVFEIGARSLHWKVYDRADEAPRFTMDGTVTPQF